MANVNMEDILCFSKNYVGRVIKPVLLYGSSSIWKVVHKIPEEIFHSAQPCRRPSAARNRRGLKLSYERVQIDVLQEKKQNTIEFESTATGETVG
jgi:hypothetical protein